MSRPIGIVGAGSVAQALGHLLYANGQPVVAVASRTPATAARAAAFIGPTVRVMTCAELAHQVSRVLIATSDSAVTSVAEELARSGLQSGAALHTCGAKGADALTPLRQAGVACGVFHPFQSIPSPEQGVHSLRGITFGVDGDPEAIDWAREIAASLGGRAVFVLPHQMPIYHAAAVFAGNSLSALLDAAIMLLERAGIERSLALEAVGPLSRTTLENTLRMGPVAGLTGPIARGDAETVQMHMNALAQEAPELVSLYEAIGQRLLDVACRRGLPRASVDALKAALDSCLTGDLDGR